MNCEAILRQALVLVKSSNGLAALEAIQRASVNANDDERRSAVELFQQALVRPEVGQGLAFQESILERAIRLASQRSGQDVPVRKSTMTDTSNNNENAGTSADTIASRGKRYTVGDTFETVATMGLKPTDAGRKASCGFQFSRKTGKAGVMDLPAGTQVRYVGAKPVYEGQTNSKQMVFRVAKGSNVILDGATVALDSDIEIAGVVNHVDADDPYNVAARANEQKRAEKATLKAQATAAKTEAA